MLSSSLSTLLPLLLSAVAVVAHHESQAPTPHPTHHPYLLGQHHLDRVGGGLKGRPPGGVVGLAVVGREEAVSLAGGARTH